MFLRRPSVVSAYLLAILATSGTLFVLYLSRGLIDTSIIPLFLLLPVGASAMGGLGPGLAAAVFAFFAYNYLFIPPYYSLLIHQTQDLFALIVFFIVAIVISQLVGQTQANRAVAEAREREATNLYALTAALVGLRSDEDIARTLSQHLLEVFQPTAIEIIIHRPDQGAAKTYHYPESSSLPADNYSKAATLSTPRGKAGEIRLWLPEPLSPASERLFLAFASQGALALERVALAQAETRAKVLEESDRLKSALLSSVSHELRSPLATIKAAATSLRGGDVPWESQSRADLLMAVDEEVDLMNKLIGNLLDMSRIESGALKPKREWNILGEIVGGVVSRMKKMAQGHKLEIDIPEDLPLVPVDYVQIEQVFTNLISNSLKYAPPGSMISITAQAKGEVVQVQVSNEGPPVPLEHLERIFDKFYRVTAADRVTGTGLGLSICKGIIEAHGGRIWAENLPGQFAFYFTLPLNPAGLPPPTLPVDPDSI